MAHKVNLDALIKRADFETLTGQIDAGMGMILGMLEEGMGTLFILRKPLFQRATSDWTPPQIHDLVKAFADRDLIPSIVIWNSPSRLQFIMDGAHRLSALIAWVNDDYGNGALTQKAMGTGNISKAQKQAHNATKQLIDQSGLNYAHLKKIGSQDAIGSALERKRGVGLLNLPIVIQTYNDPDPRRAERAFYRINQGGTHLDDKEREVIRTRRWPASIAARSIWRTGRGETYWSPFTGDVQTEIEGLATDIQRLLLTPELDIKLCPMPIPPIGETYANSGIGVLDQFVHLANNLPERKPPKAEAAMEPMPENDPDADIDGTETIKLLKKAKRLAELLNSKDDCSLGLHPGVYAYSKAGKFHAAAFFAEVTFVKYLVEKDKLFWFTEHRGAFEDFLVEKKNYFTAITHKAGGKIKSENAMLEYFKLVLESIAAGIDPVEAMRAKPDKYAKVLASDLQPEIKGKHISKGSSIASNFKQSLIPNPCPECGARIYRDCWQNGHIVDEEHGSSGHSDDIIPTHPYCNSGYRNKKKSDAAKMLEQPGI